MRITKQTVLTLPNAVSIAGFILVVAGCIWLDSWAGFALVVVGRLLDMVDGRLARSTHHASRFGAALDATLDKFAGLAIIIAVLLHGMAPAWAMIAIVIQNLLNGIATAWAMRRHPDRRFLPSTAGKYAMAVQNLALAAFVISYLILPPQPSGLVQFDAPQHLQDWSNRFFGLAIVSTVVGVGMLGLWATAGYLRRIR